MNLDDLDPTSCTVHECQEAPTWLGYLVWEHKDSDWSKRVAYCDGHVREVEKRAKQQGMRLDVTRVGDET